MVTNSRKTPGIRGSYEPLNMPVPVQVIATLDGKLARIVETRKGRLIWSQVDRVMEIWELDDEWWRTRPIKRRYCKLLMDSGGVLTVFKDLTSDEWFRQEY